jgi:hypothetical protein
MNEGRFVILKHVGKAPSLAACEGCQLKFFVPMALINDPAGAEEHLRAKYADHDCYRRQRELEAGH